MHDSEYLSCEGMVGKKVYLSGTQNTTKIEGVINDFNIKKVNGKDVVTYKVYFDYFKKVMEVKRNGIIIKGS